MHFSAFSPFGQWRFSGALAPALLIFNEFKRNLGVDNYSDDDDSLVTAKLYALAIGLASALGTAERAGIQFRPDRALELLPVLEREVGRQPEPNETLTERRRIVAALLRISQGARASNIHSVLSTALGDGFLRYVPSAASDPRPLVPTDSGSYAAPGTEKVSVRVTQHILVTGAETEVTYEVIQGSRGLIAGDKIVINPGDHGRRETVAVSAVGDGTFTAEFVGVHTIGTVGIVGRFPSQTNTKRHNTFVLSTQAAISAKARKTANFFAARLLRGVSTWSVSDESGPFCVGVGRLGVTTIGAI